MKMFDHFGISTSAFRRWEARVTLAVWRATSARATGPGDRVVKKMGSLRNGAALFSEMGVFALVSFLEERVVRERNRDPSSTTTPAGGLSL